MDPGFYVNETAYQNARAKMDLVWTSAASGALPASLAPTNYGVASVAHGATGVYVITFQQQAHLLLNWNLNVKQASYSASGACVVQVTGISLTAKTVTILVTNAAGAAVEPASGDEVHCTFVWQLAPNS